MRHTDSSSVSPFFRCAAFRSDRPFAQYKHLRRIERDPGGAPVPTCAEIRHHSLVRIRRWLVCLPELWHLRRDQMGRERSVTNYRTQPHRLIHAGLSETLHAEITPLGLRSLNFEPGFFRTSLLRPGHRTPHNPRIADYTEMTQRDNDMILGAWSPLARFTN